MSGRHRFLVMEDDPRNATELRDLLGAMDIECDVAGTLAELRAFLDAGVRPCGALLDMQVPHDASAGAHERAGETGIALVQAKWKDEERVPILVVTAFRADPEYVWSFAEKKVDGFCAKSSIALLPDKIVRALQKVGCEDHAACLELARGRSAPSTEAAKDAPIAAAKPRVALAMVGKPVGRGKTSVRICGETRLLRDVPFGVLLRAVEMHDRQPGAWLDRFELGLGLDRALTTHVRAPFKGLVPEGFEPLEADQRKRFRLNPEMVVEKVDWAALGEHPDPAIRAIAEKAIKKRAK